MTMVELLVVVAIIAALLVLLMPAVQTFRESSRATTCRNHLRQIGLGCTAHTDALRTFPTAGNAWWTPPNFVGGRPATGRQQDAGWAFQILPYLEATAEWSPAGADDTARILSAIAAKHEFYFCPSRRPPQAIRYADPYYLDGLEATHGLIDYAGSNLEGTGLFVNAGSDLQKPPLERGKVTDGLTKTLAVAEKRLNLAPLGSWQQDDNEGYTAGWDEDTMRATRLEPDRDYTGEGDGGEQFGSSHPRVFHAVFADGAVHALPFDLDARVMQLLGNVADGSVPPGPPF